MGLSNYQILKIILGKKVNRSKSINKKENQLKHYEPISGMCCFNLWCYKVTEEIVKLSDLKLQRSTTPMSEYHKKIESDILEYGFDYSKGMITVTSNYTIGDGHHRYQILNKNFGEDYNVKIRRILNVKYPFLHFLFINIFVRPLKLITKLNPF